MYRIIFIFLFICLSCSNSKGKDWKDWMQDPKRVRVLSTTVMVHDLVSQIGKEHVHSLPLIDKELDPHSYQLVKGDDEKLATANIIFYSGLGLEHGASLAYQLQTLSTAVSVGDAIKKSFPEKIIVIGGIEDPHIWMDVSIWIHAIEPIVETLSCVKPNLRQEFQQNAQELRQKMLTVHERILQKMQSIPNERRYLVTSHNSFNYFTRTYLGNQHHWEERFAAPEGLAPDGQLNPLDLQKIVNYLHQHHISIIFSESNISPDSLKKIAGASNEMGWNVQIPQESLYSDAMKEYEEDQISYLNTMEYNADIIQRYLQ